MESSFYVLGVSLGSIIIIVTFPKVEDLGEVELLVIGNIYILLISIPTGL